MTPTPLRNTTNPTTNNNNNNNLQKSSPSQSPPNFLRNSPLNDHVNLDPNFNPDDFFASPPRRLLTLNNNPRNTDHVTNNYGGGGGGGCTPELKRRLLFGVDDEVDGGGGGGSGVIIDEVERQAREAARAAVGWVSSKRRRVIEDGVENGVDLFGSERKDVGGGGRKGCVMGQGWVIRTLDVGGGGGEYGGLGLEDGLGKENLEEGELMGLEEGEQMVVGPSKCSCKASQCLKLYCPCFAASNVCGESCVCKNCCNLNGASEVVRRARETVLNRDPRAFAPKVRSALVEIGNGEELHAKGCNCRKGCEKNYCVCRENGVPCGPRCTCSGPLGCMNGKKDHGGAPAVVQKRHGSRRGRPLRQRNSNQAVGLVPLPPNARGSKYPYVLPNPGASSDQVYAPAPRLIAAAPVDIKPKPPHYPHLVPLRPHPTPNTQLPQELQQQQEGLRQRNQGTEEKRVVVSPTKTPAGAILDRPPLDFLETTPMTGMAAEKSQVFETNNNEEEQGNDSLIHAKNEERTPSLKPGMWDATSAPISGQGIAFTISPTTDVRASSTAEDNKENNKPGDEGNAEEKSKRKEEVATREGGGWSKTLNVLREKQRSALADSQLCPRILRVKMGEGRALRNV